MIGTSPLFIIFVFIGLLFFIFWVRTLIDCVQKETDDGNTRLIWVIIIVITYIVGAFLYYVIRRPNRRLELGR